MRIKRLVQGIYLEMGIGNSLGAFLGIKDEIPKSGHIIIYDDKNDNNAEA